MYVYTVCTQGMYICIAVREYVRVQIENTHKCIMSSRCIRTYVRAFTYSYIRVCVQVLLQLFTTVVTCRFD
jgi:hypothetical protein